MRDNDSDGEQKNTVLSSFELQSNCFLPNFTNFENQGGLTHLQGDNELCLLFASQIDIAELAASQRTANVEI
jgi:hypothetical protein